MSLTSMTGFARVAGARGPWRWTVEIKCVNAKGLDLRLRLPPGFDRVEAEARARISKALARGACFATISASREGAATQARLVFMENLRQMTLSVDPVTGKGSFSEA